MLPIKIDFTERQNFDEPIRTDLHLPENPKPRMRPTQFGRSRSPMLLAPAEQNAAAWDKLPPLDGANRFAGIKAGAGVLAETTDGKPLLVAQEFGAGRVLAFAADSTWHWVMGGQETAHKRFWRQVVLWLRARTTRPPAACGSGSINDGSRRAAAWSSPRARKRPKANRCATCASTPWWSSPIGQPCRCGCAAKGTKRPARSPMPWRPATTRWKSRPSLRGQPLGEAKARFLVFQQDLELDNPAADRGTLEGLAAMTGGKTLAAEQLPKLVEQIRKQLHDLDIETQIKETLWDNWPFFVLLVSVLGLEWYLRKKWGLV